ncbi:AAC(3) family N-acetyltransferase [bacterium]|nr:AAC(3) family N-acetyltransferase [bacterium]
MTLKDKVRRIYRFFKYGLRAREIKRTAPMISRERLVGDLQSLGICEGDVVLLHSSLKSIGYVDGGPNTVLEAITEVIKPSGSLVIPTYHMVNYNMYDTCLDKKYVFDPRTADTFLGLIPSAFLKFPRIERSIHPTHSVSALGKDAKYITEAHHLASSTFGTDSPWDRLMKLDGKVLGLGVTMGPVTFYHILEDLMLDEFPIPARMTETYGLSCRDWNGNLIKVPVNPHDPEIAKKRIDRNTYLADYFWNEFSHRGLLRVGKVGEATSWWSSARKFYNHLLALMNEGITIYSTPDDLKRRPIPEVDSPDFQV